MLAALLLLAGAPCDEPGPLGDLGADVSIASARIEEGVAFVRVRVDAWPLVSDGARMHGDRTVDVPLPAADAIVRGATVRTAHGVDRLRVEDAATAEQKMGAFADALMLGVEAADARSGSRRAAASVAEASDGVSVRIIAACSEPRVTVELDIELLSTTADGTWRFAFPRPQRQDVRVSTAPFPLDATDLEVLVDGGQLAGARVRLNDEPLVTVDARPRGGPRLRGRAGRAHITPRAAPADEAVESEHAREHEDDEDGAAEPAAAAIDFLRAELDLPRPLAAPAEGLHLVFVIDASVSSGAGGVAAGVRMIERILDAAPPDARWAAVAVGRRARVIVPAWRERDDRGLVELPIENGSDVASAVRLAQTMASDVDGVGRVVVLSDLAAASDDPTLAATLRPAPLVHVVQLPEDVDAEGEITWQRALAADAGTEDAAAIERSGGILVVAGAGDEEEPALAAHLIAPTRVDAPQIALGASVLAVEDLKAALRIAHEEPGTSGGWPDVLHAGEGVRLDVALPPGSARARGGAPVFRGLLWAEPLEVPLARTSARDRRALALAAVGAVADDLDDDVVRGAALEAGIVSRVTSLVHVPRWRPVQHDSLGLHGCGCCCGCGGMMSGRSGYTTRCGFGTAVDLKERAVIERLLREDLEHCRVPSAELTVEVDDLEILAVELRGVPDASAARCVSERFWLHRIDVLAESKDLEPGAFEARKTLSVTAAVEIPALDG